MKFTEKVHTARPVPLRASGVSMLQVNLGYLCNMSCKHCHVQAGPARTEVMERDTVEAVLRALGDADIETLDITGGAPELNPHFRHLVVEARRMGRRVIVRSNLTIFYEPDREDLPEFYRDHAVEVVASLPYYSETGVDKVRGSGTFHRSIAALRSLNRLGYGSDDSLRLNLVYNPQGAYLPPQQSALEEDYKRQLWKDFGLSFHQLYTFANMPIGRFRDFLVRTRNLERYMDKLSCAFNPETLEGLMCRHLVNVAWDGTLYDCDFNQVLGLRLQEGCPQSIRDFDLETLAQRPIVTGEHCYGCTAGQGST